MSTASPLRRFLEARGGRAPWREWTEAALYDPQDGYYTQQIHTVGRQGDFATSATLGPALGTAIAAWVREEWQRAGRKLPLIEIGPGDGSLHRQVLAALGFTGRCGLRCHLVERSPVLRAQQLQTLGRHRRRVTWHHDPATALRACPGGAALIFSNELADAFPATLLERRGGIWQEVWVSIADNGGIVETLEPCAPEVTSSAMDLPWPDGQRVEVLQSWRAWLGTWLPQWRAGAMLTIDYGGTPAEIYHRRPGGTVRGYRHHQCLPAAALYGAMGRCDITTDVNFTDLQAWGEAAGLTTATCTTQRELIAARTRISDRVQENSEAATAFQCLIQRPS